MAEDLNHKNDIDPLDIDALIERAWQVRELEWGHSLSMASKLTKANELTSIQNGKILVLESFHHSREFKFKQTLDTGLRALEVMVETSEYLWQARLHGRLAIAFHSIGDLAEAYRHYQLQLTLAVKCQPDNQREELFLGNHNLARQYYLIGDISKADSHYQLCYGFTSTDDYLYGYLQVNHARCLIEEERFDAARAQINTALEIGQANNVQRLCLYAYTLLAELAGTVGENDQAELFFSEAKQVARLSGLPPFQVQLKLAALYLKLDRIDDAGAELTDVSATMTVADHKLDATELYELQCAVYERKEDYKAALKHHRALSALKDEIFSIRRDEKSHAKNVANRIDALERKYAQLQSRNQELQQRVDTISELHNEARKLSELDPLTNLLNRRRFMTLAEDVFARARTNKSVVSLAVIDIDHFKEVNDQHGHQIGDEVLKALAKLMLQSVRSGDVVCRFGGEEFVILMPDTSLDNGLRALTRLRDSVNGHPWNLLTAGLSVSISCGVASTRSPDRLDDLFRVADERLYFAKQHGRDLIIGGDSPDLQQH